MSGRGGCVDTRIAKAAAFKLRCKSALIPEAMRKIENICETRARRGREAGEKRARTFFANFDRGTVHFRHMGVQVSRICTKVYDERGFGDLSFTTHHTLALHNFPTMTSASRSTGADSITELSGKRNSSAGWSFAGPRKAGSS